MKLEELMVGDIIFQHHPKDNTPHIVKVSVDTLDLMDKMKIGFIQEQSPLYRIIEPIPLTPEILEKNGFYLGYTSNQEDAASQIHCTLPEPMWTWDEGAGSIQISFPNESDGGEMYLSDQNFDRDLHFVFCENIYVHELQHAIRLCGEEKEIEL